MFKNRIHIAIFTLINLLFISCGSSGDLDNIISSSSYSHSKAYNLWEYITPKESKFIRAIEVKTEVINNRENLIYSDISDTKEIELVSDIEVISRSGDVIETTKLQDDKILIEEYDENADPKYYSITLSKSANIGDVISQTPDMSVDGISIKNQRCILSNFFSSKRLYNREFKDILEITCIADIAYNSFRKREVTKAYFKKGYGEVADVDRSCTINDLYIDDSSDSCKKEIFQYTFYEDI